MNGLDFDVDVKVPVPQAIFKTLREVAEAEGVTVGAVVREVLRTYVPPATPPAPTAGSRDEQITVMNRQGMTDREIGAALGLSYSTIAVHRKRLGLPPQGWARRAERLRNVREEVAS